MGLVKGGGTGKVGMTCLRCNGTGYERKQPNIPRIACQWCLGSGIEPTQAEVEKGREPVTEDGKTMRQEAVDSARMLGEVLLLAIGLFAAALAVLL